MTRKFLAMGLTLIATVTLSLTTTNSSSAPTQGGGKVSMDDITFVIILGAAIRNLPSGESRLVLKSGGRGSSGRQVPTGSVVFIVDGVERSVPLTKVGPGTLILPNSNRSGVPQSPRAQGGISKLGSRRLILAADGTVVYEFRNLGAAEFAQVFMPGGENLQTFVQQHRPPGGMKGWPFQRLLIGPAKSIAQVERWKRALTNKTTPGSRYVCSGGSCYCNGTSDCLDLASSCSSTMTCDSSGNRITCYCQN